MAEPLAPPPPAAPAAPGQSAVRGMFWMFVTGLCFVSVTASVKMVGPEVPAPQSGFLRYALSLPVLVLWWPAVRRAAIDRRTGMILGARGVVHALAVALWFFAMTRIPIADVTALNYLNPVYVILLAVVFLGERLGPWRIAAVAGAFIGTLIIIRPGFREIDIGHITMLFAAVAMALSYFLAKLVSTSLGPQVVVFFLSLIVPICLAPIAWVVWEPISLDNLLWLAVCAVFATLGHYTMTMAFRAAPLSVTQPVTFLQLIWATSLGALVFGEPADAFVILGGGLIIAAITVISWREARRRN